MKKPYVHTVIDSSGRDCVLILTIIGSTGRDCVLIILFQLYSSKARFYDGDVDADVIIFL